MSKQQQRLMPAVAYLRMSSDEQEGSIEQQRSEVLQYAERHGYQIIRWYEDEGISGDETERRGFREMMSAVDAPDFKFILVWNQDRFSRFRPQDAGRWMNHLAENGVQLVTLDKGAIDWNDFSGWISYSVDQHAKHQYLRDLSRNVTRGMKTSRENASWVGTPPYAYCIEGTRHQKKLVIDCPTKADIVQRIFREFLANGGNLSHVANQLNEDNVPTARGAKKWRFDSVKSILENQAYCGDFVSGKQRNGKYNTIRNGQTVESNGKRAWNDKEDWTVVRDNHEHIIDRKSFALAQQVLARNKTGKPPKTDSYLFHGLLYCRRCGAKIWGDRSDRGGVWYECSNRKQNGREACEGTKVKESELGKFVADYLKHEYLDDWNEKNLIRRADAHALSKKDLPEGFFRIRDLIKPKKHKPEQNLVRLKKERGRLKNTIRNMKRQLSDGLIDDEFVRDHQDGIKAKQGRLSAIQAELSWEQPTEQDVNEEAIDVYNSLCTLCLYLRMEVVKESDSDLQKSLKAGRSKVIRNNVLPALDKILVATTIKGGGTRTRHTLEGGEIVLTSVGSTKGNLNPHHRG